MNSEDVFNRFTQAINAHEIDTMLDLMSDDHIFTDATDNAVVGKETLYSSWKYYFECFPDYNVEIDEAISYGDYVAAFGYASGTFRGMKTADGFNFWRLPLAIKAEISDGKVRLWQVYADTKIPSEIIESNQAR
jgi:ketosteroid isomerase-like protein